MSIKPIGERILLKKTKIEEKTSSGIILTGNSTNDSTAIADVIAIGTLEKFSNITVGSKVIYPKFSGTEIKDKDETYLIVNAEDILAIID